MEKSIALIYAAIAIVITMIINAFVFQKLWMWFIVPILEINPISFSGSLGLLVFIGFIKQRYNEPKEESDDIHKITTLLVYSLFYSLFYILLGLILKPLI